MNRREEIVRWALLALPMTLALLLFTVANVWRTATVVGADGELALDYARLDRFAEPTMLRVRLPRGAGAEKTLKLRLNRSYVDSVRIKNIIPKPQEMREEEGSYVFIFPVETLGEPNSVSFEVEGVAYGQLDGELAIAGKKKIGFRQYMLP